MNYYPTEFVVGDDGLNWLPKGPLEVISYTLDHTDSLGSETIVSSSWDVSDGLVYSSPIVSGKLVSILISGGEVGRAYIVQNTVLTSGGQTIVRQFKLVIVER